MGYPHFRNPPNMCVYIYRCDGRKCAVSQRLGTLPIPVLPHIIIYIYILCIYIAIYIYRHVKPTRSLLFKENPSLAFCSARFMVRCRPIQRLSMTSPSASLFGIGTMVTILSVCWMHFSALVAMVG